MLTWLVPFAIFPLFASMYLGGSPVRLEGGSGPREGLGLILTLALFVVAWAVARAIFASFLGGAFPIVLAVIAAGLLLPFAVRLAFRVVGVRVVGRARDAVGGDVADAH